MNKQAIKTSMKTDKIYVCKMLNDVVEMLISGPTYVLCHNQSMVVPPRGAYMNIPKETMPLVHTFPFVSLH